MAALMLPPTTIIVSAQAADLRKWSRFCMPRASRRQLAHTRGRPPLRVKCMMARGQQSAVKQQKPLNASELQAKFGSEEGLQFRDVGGMTVLELSLSTGTSARLLLHEARVTSYKYRMWHGGLEEILHTDVSDTNTPPTSPHPDHHPNFLITGGIFPSFAHSHPPHLPLFDDNWHVKSVKANPDDYIQVTLGCNDQNGDGCQFSIQIIITLSKTMLASAVAITNNGKKSMMFTGSMSTHLAVRSTEAICAVGLQGCSYYSPSEAARKVSTGNQGDQSLIGKLRKFIWPSQLGASDKKDIVRNMVLSAEDMSEKPGEHNSSNPDRDETNWFTEQGNIVVPFSNGIHKLYSMPPKEIRISDQGFRRSLVLERYGFENLEVSSPDSDGEKPFVSIGYGSVLSPVNLSPKRTWKGAQVLIPDS